MKWIHHALVGAALCVGLMSGAEAHMFVGVGIGLPVTPVVPVAPLPAYLPPPPPPRVCYAPPPVYAPPVVVGYYGHPRWWYRHYYRWGYWG